MAILQEDATVRLCYLSGDVNHDVVYELKVNGNRP